MDKTIPENRILINGAEIPPEMRVDILEIAVNQHVQGGDAFDITVNTLSSEDLGLKWIDADEFTPGNEIEIQFGYLEGDMETMMVGEITALHAHYPNDAAALLNVQGFDKLHRLRRGRKTRAFYEIKDSQIAETLAGELGLTPDVRDTEVVHPYLLQNNLSDIDFLLMRARRIRHEVLVQGQTLVFREAANHLGESVTLTYQQELKRFAPRLSTCGQTSEFIVRGWNPASREAILGLGRGGDETSRMQGDRLGPEIAEAAFGETSARIVHLPVDSQAEADQIAKAGFNEMSLDLISGEGEAVGNVAIRAGTTLRLAQCGNRFSGLYYIRTAEHRMSPVNGYTTKFNAVRNAS